MLVTIGTKQLIPWIKDLLEKPVTPQLGKNFRTL